LTANVRSTNSPGDWAVKMKRRKEGGIVADIKGKKDDLDAA
jgi:hypothetical protein